MFEVSYLERFLSSLPDAFTAALARKILDLRTDPELNTHIDVLRRKANEGMLTPEEDAKYKDFVEAVDVISVIRAKAQQFLDNDPV